jgi:hypothetical protein
MSERAWRREQLEPVRREPGMIHLGSFGVPNDPISSWLDWDGLDLFGSQNEPVEENNFFGPE